MNDWQIFFVLMSKMPIYLYVAYRAYRFKHSLIMISANWLGALVFFTALTSVINALVGNKIGGMVAYGILFSLFMLAFTARELKTKEK